MSTVCAFAGQSILALLAGLAVAHAQTDALISVDFEEVDVGFHPVGFSTALTGEGGPANWVVEVHDAPIGVSNLVTGLDRFGPRNHPLGKCLIGDIVAK